MLRVTADDFGLSEKINRGILRAHQEGRVTSASLLIAAPAANDAMAQAKRFARLEVGLHLAFVEAPSATGKRNSLCAETDYFSGPCLHPHWRAFLSAWYRGRINPTELWEELDRQCQRFHDTYGAIGFLNSTQHLHLFPGVGDLIAALVKKYQIKRVRLFGEKPVPLTVRGLQERCLQRWSRQLATRLGIEGPLPLVHGFERAGKLRVQDLRRYVLASNREAEIIAHPGEDDLSLKQLYPGAFRGYRWEEELRALCSPELF